MALGIILTARAARDIEDIRAYLVERSQQAAERVRERILTVLQLLSEMPAIGISTSEANVRVVQLTQYPYRIFYRVGDGAIEVLHIRHTSRMPPTPSDI